MPIQLNPFTGQFDIVGSPGGNGTVTSVNTGTGLTGGPITSSGTISLANTAVTPGSFTNANITVDQQGRITSAANGTDTGITQLTGDVTAGPGNGSQVATLANTAVTPGSFTSANITVDSKGRITSVSNGTTVTPGDLSGAVQFNNSGSFGGDNSHFSWNNTSKQLTINSAGLTAPGLILTGSNNAWGLTVKGTGTGSGAVIEMDGSANSSGGRDYLFFSSGSSNSDIGGGKWAVKDTAHAAGIGAYSLIADGANSRVGIGGVVPTSALEVAGELRLDGSSSGFVGLKGAAAAGSTTYTLPSTDGTNGQVLSTNGSATLSWATASSGANTALSNLIATSINQDLAPNTVATRSLGTSSNPWLNAYVASTIFDGAANASIAVGARNQINNVGTPITVWTGPDFALINGASLIVTGGGAVHLQGSSSGDFNQKAAASTTTYGVVWPATQGAASTTLQNDGSGNLTWVAGGSGANTALSNLTTTSINSALIPSTIATLDLGTSTNPWRNEYLSGSIFASAGNASIEVGNRSLDNPSGFASVQWSGDAPTFFGHNANTQATFTSSFFNLEITSGSGLQLDGVTSGNIIQRASDTTTSYAIKWPSAQGAASTILQNDGSGNLSWSSQSGVVNLRYYGSSSTISSSLSTITYNTQDYDSNTAYSSGIFTVPAGGAGKYQVNAALLITGTIALNNNLIIEIQKNGTVVSRYTEFFPATLTDGKAMISDIINCTVGDTIQIQASTSATAPSIVSSNFDNYLSICRIGS